MPHLIRLKTLLPCTVSWRYSTRMQTWDTAKPSIRTDKANDKDCLQDWCSALILCSNPAVARPRLQDSNHWHLAVNRFGFCRMDCKVCFVQTSLSSPVDLVKFCSTKVECLKNIFFWLELQCRLGNACSVASPSAGEVRWKRNGLHECRAIPPVAVPGAVLQGREQRFFFGLLEPWAV